VIVPLIVLAVVFILIAVRQVGKFRIRIWQIMLGGALAVLLTGQISFLSAVDAIDPGVMIFLFGMFVVGAGVSESGYLNMVSSRLFSFAKNQDQFLLILICSMGLFSAVLMNDTMAVIGTPLVLYWARKWSLDRRAVLLALCFAITLGSVATPIGNPQNLLVASYADLGNAFIPFLAYLGIPTVINLVAAWWIIRYFYPAQPAPPPSSVEEPVKDPSLARLAKISLIIVVLFVAVRILSGFLGVNPLPLTIIALAAAAPLLILSPRRTELLRKVDWYTLIFFASMFVLMQSVYNTGVFQSVIDYSALHSIPLIMTIAVVVSQFISNVPFVALFQPLIIQQGISVPEVLALAAGSTIAGNLTILGAASNVIVVQNAEKEGYSLSFIEFMKPGLILTVFNLVSYSVFLSL
jgi:Na+/H+ antiporter NhaD/arsenite permease-like protein